MNRWPTPRHPLRGLAIAALSAAAILLLASPALADAALLRSSPADGARLTEAPDIATLTFNQPLVEQGAAASLEGPDGQVTTLTGATVEGSRITFGLPTRGLSGAQLLRWRAVSTDGHPITGTVRFTVLSGSTALSSPPTPTPTPTEATSPDDSSQWPGILVGGAIGTVLGTAWVIVGRRRRSIES